VAVEAVATLVEVVVALTLTHQEWTVVVAVVDLVLQTQLDFKASGMQQLGSQLMVQQALPITLDQKLTLSRHRLHLAKQSHQFSTLFLARASQD
jgi:hypothetical protein